MKRIEITREGSKVTFTEVSIDTTENVFFINLDPSEPHWPTLASNELGTAPSPPSSQCQPDPQNQGLSKVVYTCQIHKGEEGIINIFDQLAAVANLELANAVNGQAIAKQQVVQGGMSPYTLTGKLFQVSDAGGVVIDSGPGIGPGLQLIPTTDNTGIFVGGTPTVSGTYTFTFTVDDGMGANLQQTQYTMKVA